MAANTDKLRDKEYIGDGVYVGHDGFHLVLWLDTPGVFGLNAIGLEPEVLRRLQDYARRLQDMTHSVEFLKMADQEEI